MSRLSMPTTSGQLTQFQKHVFLINKFVSEHSNRTLALAVGVFSFYPSFHAIALPWRHCPNQRWALN
ncbi:hypothetical protein [Caldichromatium japonicum]|uniref:hypothetical protein n=1 Tax=Caldichromatium japonicum TaxID=2699430 RepID=UPI0014080831|nr:hypothetical protein [Caldichromatium japonicum]